MSTTISFSNHIGSTIRFSYLMEFSTPLSRYCQLPRFFFQTHVNTTNSSLIERLDGLIGQIRWSIIPIKKRNSTDRYVGYWKLHIVRTMCKYVYGRVMHYYQNSMKKLFPFDNAVDGVKPLFTPKYVWICVDTFELCWKLFHEKNIITNVQKKHEPFEFEYNCTRRWENWILRSRIYVDWMSPIHTYERRRIYKPLGMYKLLATFPRFPKSNFKGERGYIPTVGI